MDASTVTDERLWIFDETERISPGGQPESLTQAPAMQSSRDKVIASNLQQSFNKLLNFDVDDKPEKSDSDLDYYGESLDGLYSDEDEDEDEDDSDHYHSLTPGDSGLGQQQQQCRQELRARLPAQPRSLQSHISGKVASILEGLTLEDSASSPNPNPNPNPSGSIAAPTTRARFAPKPYLSARHPLGPAASLSFPEQQPRFDAALLERLSSKFDTDLMSMSLQT